MQSLRRELSAGLRPLQETFVALIRMFGSKGRAMKGMEILSAMEKLNYDIRGAWLILVGTLRFRCSFWFLISNQSVSWACFGYVVSGSFDRGAGSKQSSGGCEQGILERRQRRIESY